MDAQADGVKAKSAASRNLGPFALKLGIRKQTPINQLLRPYGYFSDGINLFFLRQPPL
jgi:hypothetical protein